MRALSQILHGAGGSAVITAAMLLLFVYVALLVFALSDRRRPALSVICAAATAILAASLTLMLDGIYEMDWLPNERGYNSLTEAFLRLPWLVPALLEGLLTALAAFLTVRLVQIRKTEVSSYTVKEAVDSLPVGVCISDPRTGSVTLSNLKMNEVFSRVAQRPLTDARELPELFREDESGHCKTEENDYLLTRGAFEIGGRTYTETTLDDQTEQYRKTRELEEKNTRLIDLQLRLNDYRMDVRVNGEQIYLQMPVEIGPAAGTLSLSETMIDTLDPEYPDAARCRLDATLDTSEAGYAPSFVWTSSDGSVATVEIREGESRSAIVTATGYGEALITCRTADGLYSASVTVCNSRPAVRGVEIDKRHVEVLYPENKSFPIHATVYPENAGNKRVLWRSDDETVATVSPSGAVIPHSKGVCCITAYTEDGGFEAACEVVVREPISYDLWIDGLPVTEENMGDIVAGGVFVFDGDKTLTVNKSYTAKNASALIKSSIPGLVVNVTDEVTLTDKEGVMRLSADTTITGPGTLTVSSATVAPIYVMEGAELSIVKTTLNTSGPGGLMGDADGELLTIDTATVVTDALVEGWAIFDFDGGVTLENVSVKTPEGGAFVGGTLKAADGSDVTKASIGPFVTVRSVELDRSELTLKPGDTAALSALIEPLDATNRSCTWSTTDRTVAKVDENGVVTAVAPGSARITVKTNEGRRTASCLVTVKESAAVYDNPFTDVKEGKFYYTSVLWAYYHDPQITAGTTETTFSPNDTCTRGQIVTFLYRHMVR